MADLLAYAAGGVAVLVIAVVIWIVFLMPGAPKNGGRGGEKDDDAGLTGEESEYDTEGGDEDEGDDGDGGDGDDE